MSKLETRTWNAIELRAEGQIISGVIPYGSKSADMGGWHEVLKAGCFSETIRSGARVLSFWSHDQSRPLASTDSRTLELTDTPSALQFQIHVPDTSWGRDALASVRSHVTKNCSFGFRCKRDSWKDKLRTIESAELLEISPVSWAAYPETSVRSRGITMTSMTKKIREILEERFKVLGEMRKLQDSSDTLDKEQYDKLEAEYERLTREIDLQKREQEMTEPFNEAIKPEPQRSEQRRPSDTSDPWQGKSMRIIRPGEKRELAKPTDVEQRDVARLFSVGAYNLTDAEKQRFETRRVLQMDKDVVGGFLVLPESYSAQILTELNDAVFIRSLGTQFELKGAASLSVPYEADAGDDASWTAEILTGSEDATTSYEKRSLTPHPLAKRVKLSRTLAQRAAGFQNFAISRLTYKFALSEEKAFLSGSGGGRPIGLFTEAVSGGLGISSARDVSSGNSATQIGSDGLIEALMSLKAQYRKNAVWVFHRDAIKMIRRLKYGDGTYILQPSMASDKPDTILGKRYYESEYAPAVFTSGMLVGLIGDMSYYWICTALAMDVQVLLELYAAENCVGLIGRLETDGAPILENAFARVKLA